MMMNGELAGFTIPRLGMGTMALAIEGRPDRDTAIRTIHAGLDAGVRYLDTAWSYYLPSEPGTGTAKDLGYGEKLVRDALASWDGPRDEVLVATKTGYTPIAYDLTYCSELGIGVHKLFAEGKTGCMVYVDSEGNVSPLYLKDLQDPTTGKIPPRLVDIKSDKFASVVETILNAITPADYEAAKAYVPNPEEYDFHKILNWK